MGSVKILNDDDTLTFEAVWINDDGIVIEKKVYSTILLIYS